MKRIILTMAGLAMALSLVTTTAYAGTVLSASNSVGGGGDFLESYGVSQYDPVETFWPYCDDAPPSEELPYFGCARRIVTVGPGAVEDVNITVDWGWPQYVGEGHLNLWHNGISVTLVLAFSITAPESGRVVVTFDDEAIHPYSSGDMSLGVIKPFQPLSAFDGQDAAGDWVLTVADFGPADPRRFNSFTLLVTVPEPETVALLGLALAGLGFARRRKLN